MAASLKNSALQEWVQSIVDFFRGEPHVSPPSLGDFKEYSGGNALSDFLSVNNDGGIVDWIKGLITNSGYEAILNRDFNSAEALKQREWQSAENQIARDFQLMMSNTAYQRGVADMRAAGLNPILAYSQGGAANSAVSVGHGDTASNQGIASSDLGAIASGMGSLAEGIGKVLELFVTKKTGKIGFVK